MSKQNLITPQDRKNLTEEIQQRVDELTFKELESLSNKEKNQELNKIETQIRNYLTMYANSERIVYTATKNLDLTNKNNKNLELYILYKKLLTADIAKLLQDGYILIENLRKSFTGTEIQYEIGMEYSIGKKNKQLINKTITLAELLSYAKPEIQWRSSGMGAFKLRASSRKEDFDVEYNKQKQIIESTVFGLHSLYPKIKNIITDKGRVKANEGNMYEVYMNFKHNGWADHLPGPIDPQDLSSDMIIDKYMDIKRGTQSFVSGGDFGLSQFKLLSAAPSIATLNTIGNALKLILKYIEEGKTANITVNMIKKNVFSDEFDKLSRQGLNELIEGINEELGLET